MRKALPHSARMHATYKQKRQRTAQRAAEQAARRNAAVAAIAFRTVRRPQRPGAARLQRYELARRQAPCPTAKPPPRQRSPVHQTADTPLTEDRVRRRRRHKPNPRRPSNSRERTKIGMVEKGCTPQRTVAHVGPSHLRSPCLQPFRCSPVTFSPARMRQQTHTTLFHHERLP